MKKIIKKIMVSALAFSMMFYFCAAPAYATEEKNSKEYVLCKPDGTIKKFIRSDESSNKLQYLTNDESYSLSSVVSYKLENKEVSYQDIAGSDGHISIDVEYNSDEKSYSAVTVLLLEDEHFKDIKVSSGKIISDGDKNIVIGVTKIPGTLHIEAEASKFEIKAMYALATDSLMSEIDLDDFAPAFGIDISSIKDTIKELKNMGTSASGEDISLTEGINELNDGMGQLSSGLNTLDDNSAQLTDGAKQVFQSLIDMANEEIAASGADVPKLTINNYSSVLASVIEGASPEGVKKSAEKIVEGKVKANEALIKIGVTQTVQEEVTKQVTMKVEESLKESLPGGDISKIMKDPSIQIKIDNGVKEQMSSDKVKKLINQKTQEKINSLVDENMNSPEVQGQIAVGIAKGSAGIPTLKSLKEKLDSYNKFYRGLIKYTDGVSKAAEGATTISSATSEIVGSTKSLIGDDALGLINDADELLDEVGNKKSGCIYIIKFDSIR